MTTKNNAVSPASAWRNLHAQGKEVEFPNGLTARLRSVSVGYLVKAGKMPDGLTAVALGAADIDANDIGSTQEEKLVETLSKLDDYCRILCEESFVYPKIVDEPKQDDEISYDVLSEADKQFVAELMNTPLVKWRNFREKYAPSLESVRQD